MANPTESKQAARAAVLMAAAETHEEEQALRQGWEVSVRACAVDFGGDFLKSVKTVVERSVVAARREGLIGDTHSEQGAVAGAAHNALEQLASKAMGLSVGGKIGVARKGEHVAVCVFISIGLLHLDEVAMGLSHRAVPW